MTKLPAAPTYFHKPITALNSHKGAVVRPERCKWLNYEGEIVIIIGRTCRNVSPAEAADYIAGYSVGNDYGLHDFRDTDAGSMLRVKGADTLAPASADASFRRYLRVQADDGSSRIVMDAPPPQEDVRPFIDIAARITAAGLHAPAVLAADAAQGFLLLADLGSQLYLPVLQAATEAQADGLMREAGAVHDNCGVQLCRGCVRWRHPRPAPPSGGDTRSVRTGLHLEPSRLHAEPWK
jgi:hypothetical protein